MSEGTQLRNYSVVTAAYWAFTLTDGALRMLVLGYFHSLGYSPFQLASLFFLYELCGVLTNMVGGWIGSRTGLKFTLCTGLLLQIASLLGLSALSSDWSAWWQLSWVVIAQGLSGIAKDFTKVSAKSAIKTLAPTDDKGTLFRWVAILTGSKNTLKGIGFFLGGFLLTSLGFRVALWGLSAVIVVSLGLVLALLPKNMGQASSKHRLSSVVKISRSIRVLSLARLFLFCARDLWFVVGLPVFLNEVLGWEFVQVGAYLAVWVIGYGLVQALTPKLLPALGRKNHNDARAARLWSGVLTLIPALIVALLQLELDPASVVLGGLTVFAVVFAINSSIHSYLVLAYSDTKSTSLNVGFYYMANAMGRLIGTLLSGILYQWGGLEACLIAASAMVAVSSAVAIGLPDTRSLDCPQH